MRRALAFMLRILVAVLGIGGGAAGHTHGGTHPERAGVAGSPSPAVSVRTVSQVRMPDVRLLDTQRRTRTLAHAVDGAEPVLLNFVYTTCSTICSTQTAVLSEVQRRLADGGQRARFVTLTIDPDNDTPERLAAFARQFGIERDWVFLSGDYDDLLRVQQAFDVYRGSKAAHPPVVMLRPARTSGWLRIEGIAGPQDLLAVFEQSVARR